MSEPAKARPTHQAAMLEWLEARTEGATVAETRAHFGRISHAISCGLARLQLLGLIGWLDVPNPSSERRAKKTVRRYFARAHCPPGATIAEAVKPLVRAMNGGPKLKGIPAAPNANTVTKPRPPLTASDAFKAAAPRITERTKVTIWTPQPDPRDARLPKHPPLFGKIEHGRAPEPRPWAAAVAGGAR